MCGPWFEIEDGDGGLGSIVLELANYDFRAYYLILRIYGLIK